MRNLFGIFLLVTAAYACAGESLASDPHASIKGEVLEVKNVANFTYMRLKTAAGETWAAVIQAAVKKGDSVTIENAIVMKNFESKSLKKTFSSIVFGSLGNGGANVSSAPNGRALEMVSPLIPKKLETNDEQVAKAVGANAYTVAEVMSRGTELKDKTVLVRGRVVKYNADIMGKNWVHLRDGSGSAADGSNDILVTTTGEAKLGDTVTAKGVVHTDKDFSAGYAYKVLIEEATLQ
jgi:hypothetical protein